MKKNNILNFFNEHYFIAVPIFITILIYSYSLTFGFRNFDEDVLIKNFYIKKTFLEYLQKYLLLDISGITKAGGQAFSGIQNVHFCLLQRIVFYITNFLFKANPFLFHLWGLFWHCCTLYFFILVCLSLSSNKLLALSTGIIWSLHPSNVESVIWATNGGAMIGTTLYFYTVNKVIKSFQNNTINGSLLLFIFFITFIQTQIIEYTVTLPALLFLVILYFSRFNLLSIKTAAKTAFPGLAAVFIYFFLRLLLTSNSIQTQTSLLDTITRIIFLPPQILLHQLKLVFFPKVLSIDQAEHLILDNALFGSYHLLSVFFIFALIAAAIAAWKKLPEITFGVFAYIIAISPFLHFVPLYSMCAERYNYLGAAFLIFGIISFLFSIIKNKSSLKIIAVLSLVCILFTERTIVRILDWKDSSTLFLSTIKSSESALKKGIWFYNLALSEKDEERKNTFLKESIKYLNIFINSKQKSNELELLKKYELGSVSLTVKALMRLATNYELLSDKVNQLAYLKKALELAEQVPSMRAQIYKNLGTYYFQEGNYNQAIDYYEKSKQIANSSESNFAIAACYLNLRDLKNYEKYLKSATSTVSSNGKPFQAYGQFLELEKKDYDSAIKNYKIATLLENSPEPYILLSTLYLKQGQNKQALQTVKNGLYGFSENPILLYLNGTILVSQKKTAEGINNLIRVVNNKDSTTSLKQETCSILKSLNVDLLLCK